MATKSIISIEVKDEKFKEFLVVFNKYRDAVKEMKAEWKEVSKAANEAAGESTKATKKFYEDFKKETEVLNKIPEKLRKIGQAAREAAEESARATRKFSKSFSEDESRSPGFWRRKREKTQEEMDKLGKKTKEHTKDLKDGNKVLDDTEKKTGKIKDNFTGTFGLAKDLFKIIGGPAGQLTAIFSATSEAAKEASSVRREALGVGVSTGVLRSAEVNLSPIIDAKATLEKIAALRSYGAGRGQLSAMTGMRVDENTPVEQILTTLIRTVGREYKAHPYMEYAKGRMWTQALSEENIRRIGAMQIPEQEARLQKFEKDIPILNTLDASNEKLTDFKNAVDTAKEALQVLTNNVLLPFANFFKPFVDFFANTIGGFNKFIEDWKKDPALAIANDLKSGESDLESVWNFLKHPGAINTPSESWQETVNKPSFWDRMEKYWNPVQPPNVSGGWDDSTGGTLADRNVNPVNLKFANQPGAVLGEKGFAKFSTPQQAFQATASQLQSYAAGTSQAAHFQKLSSIREIISAYAPKGDKNDVEAYVKEVVRQTGFNADARFGGQYSLNNPQVLASIMAAMANIESGTRRYTQQTVINLMLTNNTGGNINMNATAMQGVLSPGISGGW
jgi:hypothetical protein